MSEVGGSEQVKTKADGAEELSEADRLRLSELLGKYLKDRLPSSEYGDVERVFLDVIAKNHQDKWLQYHAGKLPSIPKLLETIKDSLQQYLAKMDELDIEFNGKQNGKERTISMGDGDLCPVGDEWISQELLALDLRELVSVHSSDSDRQIQSLTEHWQQRLSQFRQTFGRVDGYLSHATSHMLQVIRHGGLLSRFSQREVDGRDNFATGTEKETDAELDQVYVHMNQFSARYANYQYFPETWANPKVTTPSARGVLFYPALSTLLDKQVSFLSGDGLALFCENSSILGLDKSQLVLDESDYKRIFKPKRTILTKKQSNPFFSFDSPDVNKGSRDPETIPNTVLTEEEKRLLHEVHVKYDGEDITIPSNEFENAFNTQILSRAALIARNNLKCSVEIAEKVRTSMFFVPRLVFGDVVGGDKSYLRKMVLYQT